MAGNFNNQQAQTSVGSLTAAVSEKQVDKYVKEIEFYQQLLNNPYEGIVFVDQNGIIKYVNDSLAKYNRLTKERLIGKKHS